MPRLIVQTELIDAVNKKTFIQNGDPLCVEGIKYDFRVSADILKASFGVPVKANQLTETEKKELYVEPGEMVFVLSEERLSLTDKMMAQLSPKRKLSHAGILAIGGFCIDPLYEGRLLIGLYNLSSTRFPLRPGKKVIAATFYELDEQERGEFSKPALVVDDFPDELVEVMQRYKPMSVLAVAEAVQKLRDELDTMRKDIRSHDEWYNRFEQSLTRHDGQIRDLLQGLAQEKDLRTTGQDKMTDALNKIERTLVWLKGAAAVVALLLSAIAIPIFVNWLSKKLGL